MYIYPHLHHNVSPYLPHVKPDDIPYVLKCWSPHLPGKKTKRERPLSSFRLSCVGQSAPGAAMAFPGRDGGSIGPIPGDFAIGRFKVYTLTSIGLTFCHLFAIG